MEEASATETGGALVCVMAAGGGSHDVGYNELIMKRGEGLLNFRQKLSGLTGWLSVGLLGLAVLGLAFMWCYAWSADLYPNPRAPHRETYEAAWGDNSLLVETFYNLLYLPVFAFFAALFSVIVKPNWRTLIMALLSMICFSLIMGHLGLIDD